MGISHPTAPKNARETQKKRNPTYNSRSHYSKDRRPVTRNTGDRLPQYHSHENSSYEEDYNDIQFITGATKDQVIFSNIVPFHLRPVGPPHLGLRSIRRPNGIFDKLMSYRSYSLKLALNTRASSETNEVCLHIKNMAITLKKNMFSGADPIRIFDVLSRFMNEVDTRKMSEAKAFIELPHLFENNRKSSIQSKPFWWLPIWWNNLLARASSVNASQLRNDDVHG